jgi:peptidyl-dipeptidase Dcp
MLRNGILLLAIGVAAAACSEPPAPASGTAQTAPTSEPAPAAPVERVNPLFAASDLALQAPPFDRIEDADFKPAFEEGMKRQLAEVEAIANEADAPTFDNTLVALEKSGQLLDRTTLVFDALTSANTNPGLQALQEEMAPRQAAHEDAIYLNAKLFRRISALYEQRGNLGLDPESLRLVEWYYADFVHHGAKLSDADKAKLKELNKEVSTLNAQFIAKLLAATKAGALVIDDRAKLAGLGDGEIAAAAQDAKGRGLDGKWVIPLQNTTQQPLLASLTDRDVRKQLFDNSWTRTEKGDDNDTRATITRMAELRAEQAKLLGFESYAAWKLDDQMAKTPERALKFMRDLVPAATAKARAEAADIQALIDKGDTKFELEPWDWELYAEQVRKARFDLDEDQIKPYFELDSVLQNGVFHAANLLYGLTFKERKDLPVYQPDVRVFDVIDADGSQLGLFYADYFKRDNKGGGAWMSNFVEQSDLLGTKPVIYNVCNFTKPAPGQPALLSWDDVTTMFHEFGHALHGFFADQKYPSLSGTNVARDFVEFPSQFNEHWAMDPKVFANYAKHYQTGEAMPPELVAKIRKAGTFNQGYMLTETLSAALLDMSWHTLAPGTEIADVDAFEARALKDNGTDLGAVPPRYRSSYFMHIWGHDYAAGYYAYLWTEMLDDDAFEWFKENGGLNRANGDRFRAMVLSRGNTQDLAEVYRAFRGKDPSVEPMLIDRGLKDAPE